MQHPVDRILWRSITGGDYWNVEKALPPGPKGQMHLDLAPDDPVTEFLSVPDAPGEAQSVELDDVRVIGDPESSAPLRFRKRPEGRWNIPQQNEGGERAQRHPAWTPRWGWPRRPALPPVSTEDGRAILDAIGGVHVFVVRTVDGLHFAGMTTGAALPPDWPEALAPLFVPATSRTGLIRGGSGALALDPLAVEVLDAMHRHHNVLLYGPPGTGKTRALEQVRRVVAGGSGLETLLIDPKDAERPFRLEAAVSPLPEPTRTEWVTFHPEYGYEDFMIGLRPAGEGFRLEPAAGVLLDVALEVSVGDAASGLVIIDEINRGNVPRILGDFLTFMDPDYREGAAGAVQVRLPKLRADGSDPSTTEPVRRLDGSTRSLPVPWYFPQAVTVLATMNSVDRAVAPLDTALGRRFQRIDAKPDLELLASTLGVDVPETVPKTVPRLSMPLVEDEDEDEDEDEEFDDAGPAQADGPEPTEEPTSPSDVALNSATGADAVGGLDEVGRGVAWRGPGATAVVLLRYLNDEIAERLGVDFELGHTYFLGVRSWGDLAQVWDLQVWPQLRDRFGARPDQLAELLRVDDRSVPSAYPFARRRRGGRALEVGLLAGSPEEVQATALRFLSRGRP